MKDSDYMFLLANIFLAQFVGRTWAGAAWVTHMIFFGILLYLGR
jgi:hypothetical protein